MLLPIKNQQLNRKYTMSAELKKEIAKLIK